jgi:hypothetical protein
MEFGRLLWSLDHSISEYTNIKTYKNFLGVIWRNLTEQIFLSGKGEPFNKHEMTIGAGISLFEMVTLFFFPFFWL